LAKYAKATRNRHKKHAKRMRDAEKAKQEDAGENEADKESGRAK
jgi:hypothetical protein